MALIHKIALGVVGILLLHLWVAHGNYKAWYKYTAVDTKHVAKLKYREFKLFYTLNPDCFLITSNMPGKRICPVSRPIYYHRNFDSPRVDRSGLGASPETLNSMYQIKLSFWGWLRWRYSERFKYLTKTTRYDKMCRSHQRIAYANLLADMMEDAQKLADRSDRDIRASREEIEVIQRRLMNTAGSQPTLTLDTVLEPDFSKESDLTDASVACAAAVASVPS